MPPQYPSVQSETPSQPTVSPPLPQPVYSPQPQMSAPAQSMPMQLNPAYGNDKLATASLVLGIVSLPASILNVLTLPIPITAIVLGAISLKRKKSFAVAGIVLGVIGIILSAVVLVVGLRIEHDKKASQAGSTLSHGVSGSNLNSTCYSFSLPNVFTTADVKKNLDCVTVVLKADSTDDLLVNSSELASPVAVSDRDAYLKNLIAEFQTQIGSSIQVTSTKFTTLDGVRAYQVTGSENHGNYRYFGITAVLAPKDYFSVTGAKLRAFIVVYDSSTSQNRLDELAGSWHWQ